MCLLVTILRARSCIFSFFFADFAEQKCHTRDSNKSLVRKSYLTKFLFP